MKKHLSLIIKVIAPTIFTIMVGAMVLIGSILYILSSTANRLTNESVFTTSNRIVRELDNSVKSAETITRIVSNTLLDLMASGQETAVIKKQAVDLLKNTVLSVDSAFGGSIALEPNVIGNDLSSLREQYVTDSGRFVPYAYKSAGAMRIVPVELTSASLEAAEYYRIPKQKMQKLLSEPYSYQVPGSGITVNMVTLTQPLIRDGKFLGIVTFDISLDSFTDIFETGLEGASANLVSPGGIEAYSDISEHRMMNKAGIADKAVTDAAARASQTHTVTQTDWKDGTNRIRSHFFPIDFLHTSTQSWVVQVNIPLAVIEAPIRNSIKLALALSALVLVSVILVLFFLIKKLTITPYIELAQFTKTMATGDYTNGIPPNRLKQQDEVGEIARAFETLITESCSMLSAIRDLVHKLKTSNESLSGTVGLMSAHILSITGDIGAVSDESKKQVAVITEGADAVDEVHKDIQALDRHVYNQAAAINQSSAAIEQMVGNIASIDANIGKINEQYGMLTKTTADGMDKQQQVSDMVKNIVGFSDTLSETNQIISQISEQTNLLAMNAAIEAAHAGDAGKGFAVVADEIRKLAENSSSQSKIVNTQLQQIRNGINGIVAASSDSRQAFDSIVLQIREISNLVAEVSRAVTEQNAGSKQVLDGLQQINEITGEVQNSSREMQTLSLTVLERMNSAREFSAGMEERMNKMHSDMSKINSASTDVANITLGTTNQIHNVEEAVNRFKIN